MSLKATKPPVSAETREDRLERTMATARQVRLAFQAFVRAEPEPLEPYRPPSRSRGPVTALAVARHDLKTARRRVKRAEEVVARWEALLADPVAMGQRDPQSALRSRDAAVRRTREWTRRVAEVQKVIASLTKRARVTYCESKEYRRRVREQTRAQPPA